MFRNLKATLVIGIFIQVVWIGFFYGERLLSLNNYLFTADGDGLKSYFNITYQAKHAENATHLQGISYPFGESLFLEDAMPWLNIALHKLAKWVPLVGEYTVGVINTLYFLSLILGVIFLILIFHRFGISGFSSALVSNGLVLLSSQHLLLWPFGHLALAHVAFLPMGIWFLLRYFDTAGKLKWSLALMVNTIFWSFMHVYLGMILLFLVFATHLLLMVFNRRFYGGFLKLTEALSLQILFPLLLMILFLNVLDTHPHRIDFPFIENHRSTLASVFLPAESPLRDIFMKITGYKPNPEFRWFRIGTYLGLVSMITLVWMVVCRLRGKQIGAVVGKELWFMSGAAFLVLLYSFAFPFRFLPDAWLNQIPYLKQFSSLGRFGWAFYFVVGILSIVWIYRTVKQRYQSSALSVAGLILLLEAVPVHQKVSKGGLIFPNPFRVEQLQAEFDLFNHIKKEHYQAIIPLPTFFKFAVPINKPGTDSVIYGAMVASGLTGVPIMSTYLSRPSVTESMDIFRAIQAPPYRVPLQKIMEDTRDFILLYHIADTSLFDVGERALLAQSQFIAHNHRFYLYRLPKDSLGGSFVDTLVSNWPVDTFFTFPERKKVFRESWDQTKAPVVYRGQGAFTGEKAVWNTLAKVPVADLSEAEEYILSFWYYNHQWDQTFNTIFLSETNPKGETVQWINISGINSQRVDNWWYLVEQSFRVQSRDNTINILSLGQPKFEPWFAVDEMMIRPSGVDFFHVAETDGVRYLFKNNVVETVLITGHPEISR